MDSCIQGYEPPPGFEEVQKDPLIGISLTDSTELWLIQWPINQLQPDDFKGKEISLKLCDDGQLASFESSSGKSYDVVSFAAQEPDATVFLASNSESKVVGKVSRRVCLVHYPEPSELEKPGRPGLSSQRTAGSSRRDTSEQSTLVHRQRGSDMINELSRGATTTSHGSKERSSLSGTSSAKEHSSKNSKSSLADGPLLSEEPMRSADQSTQDSGRDSKRLASSLGYSVDSDEWKSKKKKKKALSLDKQSPSHSKRSHAEEPVGSAEQATQDLGGGSWTPAASLAYSDHSHEGKSKKKKKKIKVEE